MRLSRSSAMVSRTPLPRGSEMYALVPLPMMNTLFNLRRGRCGQMRVGRLYRTGIRRARSDPGSHVPGGEGVSGGVAHVHDVEGAGVALAGHDGAHSPQISSARDHAQVTCRRQKTTFI